MASSDNAGGEARGLRKAQHSRAHRVREEAPWLGLAHSCPGAGGCHHAENGQNPIPRTSGAVGVVTGCSPCIPTYEREGTNGGFTPRL